MQSPPREPGQCAFRRRTRLRRPLLAVCRCRQLSFYRCPFLLARRALVNALLAENLSRDMYRAEAASAITARRDCRVDTPRHCARDILLLDRGGHCRPIVSLLDLVIPAEIADQMGVQGRHPLRRRAAPLLIFWDVGYLICYEGHLDWCFMESNAPSHHLSSTRVCRRAPVDEFRFPLREELGLFFERIRFANTF